MKNVAKHVVLSQVMTGCVLINIQHLHRDEKCSKMGGFVPGNDGRLPAYELNGTRSEDRCWPENVGPVQIVPFAGFVWLCSLQVSVFMKQKYLSASNLSWSGCSHIVSLFAGEEQKTVVA